MYRALTLKAFREGVDLGNGDALAELLRTTEIALSPDPPDRVRVTLDGEDVTEHVRSPEVNASVSQVAGFVGVRQEMVARQRALAQRGGVVVDGRDIGTVVLPDADVKFFLTASLSARAARRHDELKQGGYEVDPQRIADDIAHRDALDSTRAVAPLSQAADATLIDTTNMKVDEVVAAMREICRGRLS